MIQGPMYDEIRRSTDEVFGIDDTEWRTLNVYNSLQEIILPAMSRVFFGLPLGRTPTFLTSFRRYVLAMGIGTIVIGQLPRVFKGLVVPIFNVPLRYYRGKTLKALVPVVEQQLSERSDDQAKAGEDKYDLIKQSTRVSAKMSSFRNAADPKMLAEWIMLTVGVFTISVIANQKANVCLGIRRFVFDGNSSVEHRLRHCVLSSRSAGLSVSSRRSGKFHQKRRRLEQWCDIQKTYTV